MKDEIVARECHEATCWMRAIDFMMSFNGTYGDWFYIRFAEELVCGVTNSVSRRKNRVKDSMVADVFDFTGRVVIKCADELIELGSHLSHTSL